MNQDLIWTAIGSLITGAGLVWSIIKFYTEKRDKAHDEERATFYKDFYEYQDRMEKEFEGTRQKVDDLSSMISKLNTTIEVQREKFTSLTEKFTDYAVIVRHTLERHSDELSNLGKIIRVGDK